MYFLINIIIGYLLGSIPTGFLLLKNKGIDITKNGSGNVGAMNAFEITGSKYSGFFVFLIDALKGLLSAYIPLLIFPINFAYPSLALLAAVTAHCYNPWLLFKGGRGLSTAFGGAIFISPLLPAIWLFSWIIIFVIKRNILLANLIAIFSTIILICIFWKTIFQYSFPTPDSVSSIILFSFALLIITFTRHIEPLLQIINKKNNIED